MKKIILSFMLVTSLASNGQVVNPGGGGGTQNQNINVGPNIPGLSNNQGQNGEKQSNPYDEAMGQFMPFIDPGTETIQWNGLTWNVNNQRLFRARFEKFLSTSAETQEEEETYNALLLKIQNILRSRRNSPQALSAGFKLLPQAAMFELDGRISDSLISALYNVWNAQDNQNMLAYANRSMQKDLDRENWNTMMAMRAKSIRDEKSTKSQQTNKQTSRDILFGQHAARLAEIKVLMEANKVKKEVSELKSKIEFQALIVQLFMQRRFNHALIGSSLYRHAFKKGETTLEIDGDAKDFFSQSTGLPPTMGTIETLCREAIRDVDEGVESFNFLLDNDEMESATKRLAETFFIGEYMPSLRSIPREKKRKALAFTQKSFKLLSALDVKDYTLAEKLIKELEVTATDFDSSKALGAIETSKVVANMHLAQARNAALRGDEQVLQEQLMAATALWPRNPDLKKISQSIFDSGDMEQQALIDMDRLLAQKNYREIFDNKGRYIAATARYPERQEQLKDVMDKIQTIEGSIIRAQEMSKRGLYAGAWESVEKTYADFSDDNKLNQTRADLTTKASEFVRALRKAESLEDEGEIGSSLAWYLKAQSLYPESEFAHDGIKRLAQEIIPDGISRKTDEPEVDEVVF